MRGSSQISLSSLPPSLLSSLLTRTTGGAAAAAAAPEEVEVEKEDDEEEEEEKGGGGSKEVVIACAWAFRSSKLFTQFLDALLLLLLPPHLRPPCPGLVLLFVARSSTQQQVLWCSSPRTPARLCLLPIMDGIYSAYDSMDMDDDRPAKHEVSSRTHKGEGGRRG